MTATDPNPSTAMPTTHEPPNVVDHNVVINYGPERGDRIELHMGGDARLRSNTIIYGGSTIGRGLTTGHNVTVREECSIGDDVSIWSNTVIDYGTTIGDRVKIHSNCYVAQFTVIEDDAFLAPGVTVANDLYPGDDDSADVMAGPHIGAGAQIGAGVTLLPYVKIGPGALIGSGAVVTRDIPAGMVAMGNPARVTKAVADLAPIASRTDIGPDADAAQEE
ncbi:MAG: acyltransferase, partial [Acidimicrobiales bacterium]